MGQKIFRHLEVKISDKINRAGLMHYELEETIFLSNITQVIEFSYQGLVFWTFQLDWS